MPRGSPRVERAAQIRVPVKRVPLWPPPGGGQIVLGQSATLYPYNSVILRVKTAVDMTRGEAGFTSALTPCAITIGCITSISTDTIRSSRATSMKPLEVGRVSSGEVRL